MEKLVGLILLSIFSITLGQQSVGTITDIYSYPYTASVIRNGEHSCVGAIISEEYALTSASCLNQGLGSITLRVGSSYPTHSGEVVSISEIIPHPEYNISTVDFDLALLKFSWKIHFDYSKDAVALPEEDEMFPAQQAGVVTTWAWTVQIRFLEATTVTLEHCRNSWAHLLPVPKGLECAYVGREGMDACFEDYGSPLVVNGKLFGVSSLYANCDDGLPRMYGSTVAGRKFIKDVVGI